MKFSWVCKALGASFLASHAFAYDPTDMLMDADSAQTGYLPNHNMDPAVISGGSFGQIWKFTAPTGGTEQFYAKPLVYTPSSTGRQVVLSFSEQNNIYVLDAVNGTLYNSRSLSSSGEPPFQVSDLGSCNDISGTIGVTGTPVIDPTTDTVYFWAKSYGSPSQSGWQNGAYRFHAIDAVTLKERPGFPINLQGTPADNDKTRVFNGGENLQRTGLNLVNGVVFAGFGGHCDQYNYTGWVVGVSTSGHLATAYATSGGTNAPLEDGTFNGGGGGCAVWMGGSAIASDNSGRIFFATGNGQKKDDNQNTPASGRILLDTLSEAVVNMGVNATTGKLFQQDYFETYQYIAMDQGDRDLGAGGVQLPDPSVFSGGGVSRMAVACGKNGIAYIMNADNLGGYKLGPGGSDAIIQTINMPGGGSVFANTGTYPLEGGYLYITPVGHPTQVYSLGFTSAGLPAFTLVGQSPDVFSGRVGIGPPTITTLNGQPGTGILWIIDPDAGIKAYNAVPVNGNLTQIPLPFSPAVSNFQRPGFGNGRLYISTSNGNILAYGSPVAQPLNCNSPVSFGSVAIGHTETVTVTCTANIPLTTLTGFTLGKPIFQVSNSSLPTGAIKAGASFSFPATLNLTSNAQVTPGVQTTSISIGTVNGVSGYSTSQPVTLTGTAISSAPFIEMNPVQVVFDSIVVGSAAAETGSSNTFVLTNAGLGPMTITGLAWTNESVATGAQHNVTIISNAQNQNVTAFDANGYFSASNMPVVGTVLQGGTSITVEVNFDSSITGSYFTALIIYSDGGEAYTLFTGTASTSPYAVLSYSNGEGGWTTIPDCPDGCTNEIDFANSPGLTQQTIQLKISNIGGSPLTITKSKPLEGAELGATNPNTDFSEGMSIAAGSYALGTVLFSPAAAVLNADNIYYSGTWTLNTDDLTFGVHVVNFTGTLVSRKVGPLSSSGNAIYKYLGCYQDYMNGIRIESKEYVNTNNTNGLCQSQAQAYSSVFAGTEYMQECWVGSSIPPANLLVSDTNCAGYACSGDSTQACGGPGGFISIYYDSTRYFPANGSIAGPLTLGPSIPKTVGGYTYAGCWTDSQTARVLSTKSTAGSTVTLESCAAFCSGYSIFGTEYADECYCGNTLAGTSAIKPDTDCGMTCAGNATEFCGAGSRLSLYTKNAILPSSMASSSTSTLTTLKSSSTRTGTSTTGTSSASVGSSTTSTSSTSTSAAPTPTIPTVVGAYTYLHCHSDNTTIRTLQSKYLPAKDMTIEHCAGNCTGYAYFGVEYSQECYCSNTLTYGSYIATDGRCNMLCGGNAYEVCGGPNGLTLYQNTALLNGGTSSSLSSSSSTTSSVSSSTSSISSATTSTISSVSSATTTSSSSSSSSMSSSSSSVTSTSQTSSSSSSQRPSTSSSSSSVSSSSLISSSVITTSTSSSSSSSSQTSQTTQTSSVATPTPTVTIACPASNGTIYIATNGDNFLLECFLDRAGNDLGMSYVGSYAQCAEKCAYTTGCVAFSWLPPGPSNPCYMHKALGTGNSDSSVWGARLLVPSSSTLLGSSSTILSTSSSSVSSSVTISTSSLSSSSSSLSSSISTSSLSTSGSSQLSSTSSGQLSTSSVSSYSTSSLATSSTQGSSSSTLSQLSSPSSIDQTASTTSSSSLSSSSISTMLSSTASSSTTLPGSTSSSSSVATTSPSSTSSSSTIVPSTSSSTSSSSSSTTSASSSSSTSSTLTTLTTSTASSSSSSTSASATPTPGWTYVGCANDTVASRALNGATYSTTTAMTIESCQAYCNTAGWPLAGLEYASECYCGGVLSYGSLTGLTGCTMACSGNKAETCGGSSRLSVYNNTAFVAPKIVQSVVASTGAMAMYKYQGCFTELTNARALSAYAVTSSTLMTAEYCVAACSGKGYAYAGLEYGSQCYCGNTLATGSSNVADWQCQVMLCPGNKGEYCSAGNRLIVYLSG